MRLLSRIDLDLLWQEWNRQYGIISRLFHGTARLSDSEISQVALNTVTLCGRIILTVVVKEGTRLPSVAATHFGYNGTGRFHWRLNGPDRGAVTHRRRCLADKAIVTHCSGKRGRGRPFFLPCSQMRGHPTRVSQS